MLQFVVQAVKNAPVELWIVFGLILLLKVIHWWRQVRGRV